MKIDSGKLQRSTQRPKRILEKAGKAVLVMPFKLLWMVAKAALLLMLAGLITLAGYGVYRSNQPMVVPEARGITYRQFVAERLRAAKALDEAKAEYGKRRACVVTDLVYLHPGIFSVLAPQMTLAVLYPDSRFAKAVIAGDSYAYRNLPVGSEPVWHNVLPLYWEAVERETWTFSVIRSSRSKVCPMPPVDFSAIAASP